MAYTSIQNHMTFDRYKRVFDLKKQNRLGEIYIIFTHFLIMTTITWAKRYVHVVCVSLHPDFPWNSIIQVQQKMTEERGKTMVNISDVGCGFICCEEWPGVAFFSFENSWGLDVIGEQPQLLVYNLEVTKSTHGMNGWINENWQRGIILLSWIFPVINHLNNMWTRIRFIIWWWRTYI